MDDNQAIFNRNPENPKRFQDSLWDENAKNSQCKRFNGDALSKLFANAYAHAAIVVSAFDEILFIN